MPARCSPEATNERKPILPPEETLRSCVACGGTDLSPLFVARESGYLVQSCRVCGLIFYNPRPSQTRLREYYESRYYGEENPHILQRYVVDPSEDSLRFDERLRYIETRIEVGRLLDVGCAAGAFLERAVRRGWDAEGVEVSPPAASIARERLKLHVTTGTVAEAAIASAAFDVVTLWDVLEHLADPRHELEEIARVLRPGGALFLVTQNARTVGLLRDRESWYQFDPVHLLHFSPGSLTRLLRGVGFRQVETMPLRQFEPPEATPATGVSPAGCQLRGVGHGATPSRVLISIRWRLFTWLPLQLRLAQGYSIDDMMAAVAWK